MSFPIIALFTLVAILIVALIPTYRLILETFSWHIWFLMLLARPRINAIARKRGVQVKVTWTGAVAISPKYLSIWLRTDKDFEREILKNDSTLRPAIDDILRGVGYPRECIPEIGLAIQSQQTVDRDSGGNWFLAMK